jgi:hypothetical protein
MLPADAFTGVAGNLHPAPVVVLCAVVAVAAAVWAASALRPGSRAAAGTDTLFWNTFTAGVLLLPAVLIPAVAVPPLGLGVALLAAAAALAAVLALPRWEDARRRARAGRALPALALRHQELVAHWSRYELEPDRQIDFPAMSDVRSPATRDLVRALAEAERLRGWPGQGAAGGSEYARAVLRLQGCLARAETAAGVPREQRLRISARPKPLPVR